MNPDTQRMHELTPEFMETLTPDKRAKVEKDWAKFRTGEIVHVRPQTEIGNAFRCAFKISEISENRMVLVPLGAT